MIGSSQRSLDRPELPNNLPAAFSPFVGRTRELTEVAGMLRMSRLLTLTGAGGSGKTRLALEAATQVLDEWRDGVWLVELATVNDPSKVSMAVAGTLELHVDSDRPTPDVLAAMLRDQAILLILDNCEHLLDSIALLVSEIVEVCPKVSILATSREPLGVDGERVYRVRSLSLPPEGSGQVNEVADSDAVQLFAARAGRRDLLFKLNDGNAHFAASVCRRLDGMPLAIELAAATHGSMTLDELSRRLDERFRLLTGSSSGALPRQQTLEVMIAWSYEQLTDSERSVLRRLSVFVDGFDLDAAATVCATELATASEVGEIVRSLVDSSLVGAERASGTTWYSMLEVIRQFAAERLLEEDGRTAAIEARRRHADYALELCELAAPHLLGGDDQIDWMHRLDREWGNLQSALTHFEMEPDGVSSVVRLVWSFGYFDLTRGHREPYAALASVLDRTREGPPDLRCQALLAWAKCAGIFDSDVPTVLEADVVATQEALALAQQLGERSLEIIAMLEQARACMLLERPDAAARLAEECLVLADLDGSAELCGRAHALLGAAAGDDDDRALAHHLEALGCFREAGNRVMECTVLMLIAINGWESRQRVSDGRSALEMALGLADQLGSAGQRVYLWGNLSLACAILDDYEAAEAYCRRNLRSVRRLGMTRGFLTYDMLVMSHCAAHKGDAAVATQLAGASDAFWTDVARPAEFILTPMELDLIARNKAHLRGVLGESEFERLFSDGQRLSVDQAVDLALWRVPSAE